MFYLDSHEGTTFWACFSFSRTQLTFSLLVSVFYFGGVFVWVVFQLVGDKNMLSQFQRVTLTLLLLITNQYPRHLYCQRCLSIWCRFDLVDLWNEARYVLQTNQFAYRKGIDTCSTLLSASHILESGQETKILRINFSSAFVRVNHLRILYKLCCVGIGGSVLCVSAVFL